MAASSGSTSSTMECVDMILKHMDGLSDNSTNTANIITNGITSKSFTLLEMIETLGDHFTCNEASVRSRATLLLAEVLHQLPVHTLTLPQVTLLEGFLCEKLEDHFTIQPHALYALLSLSYCHHLTKESVHTICRSIFSHVHTQSLSQGHRNNVYTLFLNFLHNYLSAVREMGADFVCGFIQAMEAEKDPRNLLLAFRCAAIISTNLSLGTFTEELFDVVSCYFPIDFHPPPTDTSGISKDILVSALRSCLSATPKFASYCMPLLLEKIDSDIESARNDAYLTLAACATTYGATHLHPYLTRLLAAFKKEIFNQGSSVVVSSAVCAFSSVMKTVSSHAQPTNDASTFDTFVDDIIIECRGNITDSMSSLLSPSCQIFEIVIATSPACCSTIIGTVVPLVTHRLRGNIQIGERKKMVDVLVRLMQAADVFSHSLTVRSTCRGMQDDLQETLTASCHTPQGPHAPLITSSLSGFSLLIKLDILSDENMEILTNEMLALSSTPDSAVRGGVSGCLRDISEKCPPLISRHVLPLLLKQLESYCDANSLVHTLASIEAVCIHTATVSASLPALSDLLDHDLDSIVEDDVVKTLRNILANNVADSTVAELYKREIIPRLFRKWSQRASGEAQTSIDLYGDVLQLLVTHLDPQQSRQLRCQVYERTLGVDCDPVNGSDCGLVTAGRCEEIQGETTHVPLPHVSLVYAYAVCQPQDITDLQSFMSQLFTRSLSHSQTLARLSAAKLYASFINKMEAGSSLDELLMSVIETLTKHGDSGQSVLSRDSLTLWVWLTKALVLRSHPLADRYTDQLMACLSDSGLGREAAAGFGVLMTSDDVVMNKNTRSCIKRLHRQLFLQNNVLKLTAQFAASTTNEGGTNYLLALSHILQALPQASLQPYMSKLFPLLLRSLDVDDPVLLLHTLTSLTQLRSVDGVVTHVESLITRLLQLSSYPPSMMVRVKAIECLVCLTSLPYESLRASQTIVVKSLMVTVNDRKRVVREIAANASRKWYLLGSG